MDLEINNISDFSNAEIAEHMRVCNYEMFKTLVRMHLSFELDLNTDEFDLPDEIAYEDQGKLKKWSRTSKKQKTVSDTADGCASGSSATTSPAEYSAATGTGVQQQIDAGFYAHMHELKQFLLLEKSKFGYLF